MTIFNFFKGFPKKKEEKATPSPIATKTKRAKKKSTLKSRLQQKDDCRDNFFPTQGFLSRMKMSNETMQSVIDYEFLPDDFIISKIAERAIIHMVNRCKSETMNAGGIKVKIFLYHVVQYVRFYKQHNRPPYHLEMYEGFSIRAWANNLRSKKKTGELAKYKILLMDSINLNFDNGVECWQWVAPRQCRHRQYIDNNGDENFLRKARSKNEKLKRENEILKTENESLKRENKLLDSLVAEFFQNACPNLADKYEGWPAQIANKNGSNPHDA